MQTTNLRKPLPLYLLDEMTSGIRDDIARAGIAKLDANELTARRERAKAHVLARKPRPFNATANTLDRELDECLQASKDRADSLRKKREIWELRHLDACERTPQLPAPNTALAPIVTTAICLFALCFAPTIFGVFLAGMGDAILAMAVSIAIGSAVGGFLCLLILEPETGASSKKFSLLGIGLGVGFGLLRIAQADGLEGYLTAIALTVLECITVVGLDWFAAKRRNVAEAYRTSRTQIVALEQAISGIDGQIAKEESAYAAFLRDIEDRENEDFDPQQLAEEAGWAVEAEYRASINANEQRRLGGAPTAYQPGR